MGGASVRIASGVDLVSVPRVARLIESGRDALLLSVWTDGERATCRGRAERLAARWAAKEATLKALGVGLDSVPMRDVEVLTRDGGAPSLALHGTAARIAEQQGLSDWSVSLSHDGDYAMAMVVAVATSADKR